MPGTSRQSVNKEPGGWCELVMFPLLSPWLWSQAVVIGCGCSTWHQLDFASLGNHSASGFFVHVCV